MILIDAVVGSMTVRGYCVYFSGKEEAVFQALLSFFHALRMQDSFDLLHNLMNAYLSRWF
jgi:hypothetical protein